MRTCPFCKSQIGFAATVCPNCTKELPPPATWERYWLYLRIIGSVALFIWVSYMVLGGWKKTCEECKAYCKTHPDKQSIRMTGSIYAGEMQCEIDECSPDRVTDGPCK